MAPIRLVLSLATAVILGVFPRAAGQPESPLTITCNPDTVAISTPGISVTVTDDQVPIAVASGGVEPYTYTGSPDTAISVILTPVGVITFTYSVTDAVGATASCTTALRVVLAGECPDGSNVCDDPHMRGLRGQHIDWSGVDGGWYSMVKDDSAGLHVNVRLTAPLPHEFPDRQLITGLSVLSEGNSLVIEVKDPYTIATAGCPLITRSCLADGGLRVVVNGKEANDLLQFSRNMPVVDGVITMSASNLPVECRQFGGDKIWARMYEEMLSRRRVLASADSLEDWILSFHDMAAPDWCLKYIAENDLADLQATHAVFKIDTPTVTVRLNAGVNSQGDGELDWDGRVLPDLEFWQMDVGLDGLNIDNPALSGILGETAHPVYDETGRAIMEGFEAFRGDVEDYRVLNPLGTHFALLDKQLDRQ